jgi:hypothetical protein
MNPTREDTLFALRYAVRVLERSARLWFVVGGAFKFATVLSGTVALGALTSQRQDVAVALGLAFAVLQALEVAMDPSGKRTEALVARAPYAKLLALHAQHDDASLEREYQSVVAGDTVMPMEPLKRLAYNDVVTEQGLDPAALFKASGVLRFIS